MTSKRSPRAWARALVVAAVAAAGVLSTVAAHAAATSGVAFGWGTNDRGWIGDGTTTPRSTPVPLATLPNNVKQIAEGPLFTVAVIEDGSIYVWGFNGAVFPQRTPIAASIVQAAVGWDHIVVLDSTGAVWAWGINAHGEVGDGTAIDRVSPVRLTGLPHIKQVAAGYHHTLALTDDGRVWAWGEGDRGQLGFVPPGGIGYVRTPTQVPGLTGVTQVAAAERFSLAVVIPLFGGNVLAWGQPGPRLGNGTNQPVDGPTFVVDQSGNQLGRIRSVAAGDDHVIALGLDGTVWAWGSNHFQTWDFHVVGGQVGDGTMTDRSTAVHLGLSGIVQVAAGRHLSAALRSDGKVFGWGVNQGWRVGTGSSNESILSPAMLPITNPVISVSMGYDGGHAIVTPNVTVPTAVGFDQDTATSAITAAGLVVGTVTRQVSLAAAGTVIAQSPPAGAAALKGSAVNITVSIGGVIVPNVLGDSHESAANTLTSKGLSVDVSSEVKCVSIGDVFLQSPHGNTLVAPGTTVRIIWDSGTRKACAGGP